MPKLGKTAQRGHGSRRHCYYCCGIVTAAPDVTDDAGLVNPWSARHKVSYGPDALAGAVGWTQPLPLVLASVAWGPAEPPWRLIVLPVRELPWPPIAAIMRWRPGARLSARWMMADVRSTSKRKRPRPAAGGQRAANGRSATWERLSATQREIAALVREGLTNVQIARRVHLSPHTVNYHLRSIYTILEINSRVRLSEIVRQHDA